MGLHTDFLFKNFKVLKNGFQGEIPAVATHSRKVKKGLIFVALKGFRHDGHCFLKEAITNGASVLLVEKTSEVPLHFQGSVFKAQDTRVALLKVLHELYDFPHEKLFSVGVTGTNGKTTVAWLIAHLFESAGWKTGLVGTIHQRCGENVWPSLLTTPEPVELFERLQHFLELGAKALVMEVSSIGLHQKRLEGLDFNIGLFTNLGQDHLDYHKNMEEYFQAKKKLFLRTHAADKNFRFVINRSDSFGRRLLKELNTSAAVSFGENEGDFSFTIKTQGFQKTVFHLKGHKGEEGDITIPLMGAYNVSNAVGAFAAARLAGFSFEVCRKALENFSGLPGRLEEVTPMGYPFCVFIDYAHTPDALNMVLKAVKSHLKKEASLITVFGCGGDRDRQKRSAMMQTALLYSNKVILTSDNPRFEDREQILKDCLKGCGKGNPQVLVEWDRKAAIKSTIQLARPGDCVLIAGKGHETYQIIKEKKYPFSDKEVARSYL